MVSTGLSGEWPAWSLRREAITVRTNGLSDVRPGVRSERLTAS